jgi:hypothetical protein
MQQLEATMRHVEDCVRAALATLPAGVVLDNVPWRPDAHVLFRLKSFKFGIAAPRESAYTSKAVFGKVSFSATLDHEDSETQGKAICWILQSLRERLKIGSYRRVKITKNMELFKAKSMTYTKLTITVSFSDLIDTSFQYDLLWAAAVSQQ